MSEIAYVGPGGAQKSSMADHPRRQSKGGDDAQTAQSPAPPSRASDLATEPGRQVTAPLPLARRIKNAIVKFGSFVGPGFMIAVAYIDPGNYSTGVSAGATYQFRLLFVVLIANLFAIFLQTLCIKLGTVSGLNLAQACRAFLPRWVNYVLYFFGEAAIVATDIAEVIGFAIGLNLLFPAIPLVVGCAISIVDVMLILLFYQPNGSMKGLRLFEAFIIMLVLGVAICFCIQLSLAHGTDVGTVFRGYLPSSAIVEQQGLYQACGILGATVMPHSLYLGSGIVQPRLRLFDAQHGNLPTSSSPTRGPSSSSDGETNDDTDIDKGYYTPSLGAIRYAYRASATELAIALFTFALFVNSSIVIVSGISLYNDDRSPEDADDADIFSLHALLSDSISSGAGTIFALALILSGVSAGIVCTITGQMVSEGALNWRMRPWLRRLITRSISIVPSIIIAAAVGRSGLSDALNASQVVLSIVLPFVSAPLIYFTSRDRYMTVKEDAGDDVAVVDVMTGTDGARGAEADVRVSGDNGEAARTQSGVVKMANSWYTTAFAVVLWLAITVLNVANLVLLGLGK